MDLIYMKANKEDVGVMKDYTLDLAFGSEENDFECKIATSQHCCEKGFFLYIENTEYGGIVDDIAVDTEVTYIGRTWHGILNSKVLCPDANADYLVVSGDANTVLATLINRMGLNSLFKASSEASGINISNYKINRYIEGYDGIKKMLKAYGAKLIMSFKNGFVELSAKPIVDYSQDEQFDTDLIDLKVKKRGNILNHVICLGKGDLKDREVIHVYADANGNISNTQVFTGLEEVTGVYENANAEDSAELKQGGIDMIKEAWASDEIDFDFTDDAESYDIGDIVGAEEHITNTAVAREITKKIVTIKDNTVTVSYPSDSGGSNRRSVSSGGGSSTSETDILAKVYPVGSVYVTSTNENPASLLGGTWELFDKTFSNIYGTRNDLITINDTNVTSTTLYVVRSGHTARIRIAFTSLVSISDTEVQIGTIDLKNLGFNTLLNSIRYTGSTDAGNVFFMGNIAYNTGIVTVTDIVGADTVAANTTGWIIDIVLQGHRAVMLDSACDKFYWRRTA